MRKEAQLGESLGAPKGQLWGGWLKRETSKREGSYQTIDTLTCQDTQRFLLSTGKEGHDSQPMSTHRHHSACCLHQYAAVSLPKVYSNYIAIIENIFVHQSITHSSIHSFIHSLLLSLRKIYCAKYCTKHYQCP